MLVVVEVLLIQTVLVLGQVVQEVEEKVQEQEIVHIQPIKLL